MGRRPESTVDAGNFSLYDRDLKKILLMTSLLILVELFFLTALLPPRWQYKIGDAVTRAFQSGRPPAYDYSTVTHPAVDSEIEQALNDNLALRITLDVLFVGLLAANTFAIVRLSRKFRRTSNPLQDLNQ